MAQASNIYRKKRNDKSTTPQESHNSHELVSINVKSLRDLVAKPILSIYNHDILLGFANQATV